MPQEFTQNNSPAPTNPPLKQIRTFQGDVARALKTQNESLYSIHETEKLKQASGGTVPSFAIDDSPKRRRMAFLLLGGILFIILGLAGAWLAYNEFLKKTAPPVVTLAENRFITPQQTVDIDLTGTTRDRALEAIQDESGEVGKDELKHLVLRKGIGPAAPLITSTEFFLILGGAVPSNLIRAFEPLFMLGTLGESRFLIFKISSYDNAFGGMLNWENRMPSDIGPIFSTNDLVKNIPSTYVFKDIVSKNKDVRALFAPIGPESTSTTPVLLYSFFDNRMLIITDSLDTLKTLIDRLTQESLSR